MTQPLSHSQRAAAWARTARAKLIAAMGSRCAGCDASDYDEVLEFDHPNGRDWSPRKTSRWMRVIRYRRDWLAGNLRLLCRSCNARSGGARRYPRTRAAVVALLSLIASTASAEFTDPEKANVHSLLLGVNLIRSGLQDQIAAQSWSGYYTAWQAAVDCHDALGYLFGTQIKQGESERAALASLPRSSWLTLAWTSLDRCVNGLGTAQSETSATNKYGQAQLIVAQFPRFGVSPLYQQPKPLTYPKVIGPHGDYDFSQEDLWFAIKYAHDALYLWGSRYLCDVANYEGIIMGALANVRFTASETADGFDSTTRDTIDNVLWLQKFALQDTVTKYLAATMNEFAAAPVANRLDALMAVVKSNDSWKNLDRAIRNTVCLDGRVNCDRTAH